MLSNYTIDFPGVQRDGQKPRFLAKFGLFKRAVWWYNKSVHGKNGAFENKSLWHWAKGGFL